MEHISNSDQTDVGESSESHHQILISNIISKIESLPKVVNVDHVDYPPVDQNDIQAWERKHTCSMPDDLKAFYMLSNGFLLTWSVLFDGQKQSLGRMVVNSLKSLKRINDNKNINGSIALDDIVCSDNDECGNRKPQFDPSQSWIFELDDCDGYGKVCLVYKLQSDSINQISPEVWFLDRALGWHYLTDSFTKYFRLMIMHLGLPQWQYALTNIGLSPIAKQWFHMYAPVRLALDTEKIDVNPSIMQKDETTLNKLDSKKLFGTKEDKPEKNVTNDRRKPSSAKKPDSNSNLNKSVQSKIK